MITTLISIFTLLCGSIFASPLHFIHQKHLDSPEGRTQFLREKLTPYVEKAHDLNEEVTHLAIVVESLSPEFDQEEIVERTNEITQKMEELQKMLPILDEAKAIDSDFQELSLILEKSEPLSQHEEEVLKRIVHIYRSIPQEL